MDELLIRNQIRRRMNLSEDILNDYTLDYYINFYFGSSYGWSTENLILKVIDTLKYYLRIK